VKEADFEAEKKIKSKKKIAFQLCFYGLGQFFYFYFLVKLVISQSKEIYLSVLLANLCHKKMWGPSIVIKVGN
jgi:hypothetical protein